MAADPRKAQRTRKRRLLAMSMATCYLITAGVIRVNTPDATISTVLIMAAIITLLLTTLAAILWRGFLPVRSRRNMYDQRSKNGYYDI